MTCHRFPARGLLRCEDSGDRPRRGDSRTEVLATLLEARRNRRRASSGKRRRVARSPKRLTCVLPHIGRGGVCCGATEVVPPSLGSGCRSACGLSGLRFANPDVRENRLGFGWRVASVRDGSNGFGGGVVSIRLYKNLLHAVAAVQDQPEHRRIAAQRLFPQHHFGDYLRNNRRRAGAEEAETESETSNAQDQGQQAEAETASGSADREAAQTSAPQATSDSNAAALAS